MTILENFLQVFFQIADFGARLRCYREKINLVAIVKCFSHGTKRHNNSFFFFAITNINPGFGMDNTYYLKIDTANFYVLADRVFIFSEHYFNNSFANVTNLSFLKHIYFIN